jgi:hypothetical protein
MGTGETKTKSKPTGKPSTKASALPLRNKNYPDTHIAEILVSLDDPDHEVKLVWAGPQATEGQTGPFRSSPGAGLQGLNCDDVQTSHRDGSRCTPKGEFVVEGFAAHLNDDPRAKHVTWFVRKRGIGLHYYPEVPTHAASHGCVRLESLSVAQLIHDNSVSNLTKVIVSGTWTKPEHQWPRA